MNNWIDGAVSTYAAYLAKYGLADTDNITPLSTDKAHILIACFPKSASRRLTEILLGHQSLSETALNYSLRTNEVEGLDVGYLAAANSFDYVCHSHLRCYRTLPHLLARFNIKTLLLVRNIYDCVVSLKEHIDGCNGHIAHLARVPDTFEEMSDEEKYGFVIDHIVPWYVSFYVSWQDYLAKEMVLASWITYEELIADSVSSVLRSLQEINIHCQRAELDNIVRQIDQHREQNVNVGRSGRGKELLTDAHIIRIKQLFLPFRHYDLSRLGL